MAQVTNALLGALMMGVLAGSAMLWWQAVKRLISRQPILTFEPRRPVPWGMLDLFVIFVIVMLTLFGGQSLAYRIFELKPVLEIQDASVKHLAVSIFSSSLALLASCVVSVALLRLRGATWSDLGMQPRKLFLDACLGVGAFVMLAPPMYFIQFLLTRIWPSEHPLQTMLLEDPQLSIILGATFTAVVVAPLTEEIFFRLVFQGWMEKVSRLFTKLSHGSFPIGLEGAEAAQRETTAVVLGEGWPRKASSFESAELNDEWAEQDVEGDATKHEDVVPPQGSTDPYASPVAEETSVVKEELKSAIAEPPTRFWPVYVSAAVFAALHWGHGPDPVPLFFLALGLGYLYQRTHRIFPCIVVHFLVNGLSMLALVLFLLSGQELP